MMINQKLIDELLIYNQQEGAFYWRHRRGPVKAGARAGSITKDGYWVIGIKFVLIREHHLVWFMETGLFPPKEKHVDHINRNRLDNRFSNLRLADQWQNLGNCKLSKNNTTGHRNVVFNRKNKSYQVQISVNGVRNAKCGFATVEEAAAVASKWRAIVLGDFAPFD